MAEQSNVMEGEIKSSGNVEREYRKGNWTLHETLVLISAKKMDDERRMNNMKGSSSSSSAEREQGKNINKPAEQRWKWVEDYCWMNGCMRSQNQCNDRWDNLMRDYKKVREHERKAVDGGGASYWKLERHERKDKSLPSNLLPQIYEALVEVVERKDTRQKVMINKGPHLVDTPTSTGKPQPSSSFMASPVLQHHKSDSSLLRPPALLRAPVQPAQALPTLGRCVDSSDSDVSEYSNSPTKRRRKGEASSSSNTALELGSAISKGASIIEKALLESEEKEEKRHKSLIDIEERRLKVEESKSESSLQAINGLTDAINQLATSIFAMVSDRNQTDPK